MFNIILYVKLLGENMSLGLIVTESFKYKNKFNEYLDSNLNRTQNIIINFDDFGIDYYNSESPIKAYYRKPKDKSIFYVVLPKSSFEYTYFFGLARHLPYTHYYGVEEVSPLIALKLNTKDKKESTILFAIDKDKKSVTDSDVSVLIRINCQSLSDVELAFLKEKNTIFQLNGSSTFLNLGFMHKGSFDLISKLRNFISNVTIKKSDTTSLILESIQVPEEFKEKYDKKIKTLEYQKKKVKSFNESKNNKKESSDFNKTMEERFNSKFSSTLPEDILNLSNVIDTPTKKCDICGEEKTSDNYYQIDGDNDLKNTCKNCINKINAAKYLEKILQTGALEPGQYFIEKEFIDKYPNMKKYLSTLKEENLMIQDINRPSNYPKRTYFETKDVLEEFLNKYSKNTKIINNSEQENFDKHIFCMWCGEFIESTYEIHPKYKKFVDDNPNKCANCIKNILIAYLKSKLKGKYNSKSKLLESVKNKELMEKYLKFLEDNNIISNGEKLNFKNNNKSNLEELDYFFNEIPKEYKLEFNESNNLKQEDNVLKKTYYNNVDEVKESKKDKPKIESKLSVDETLKEIDRIILASENILNYFFKLRLRQLALSDDFTWNLREELINKAKKGEIKKKDVSSYINKTLEAIKRRKQQEGIEKKKLKEIEEQEKIKNAAEETINEITPKDNIEKNKTVSTEGINPPNKENAIYKNYLILNTGKEYIFVLEGIINNKFLIETMQMINKIKNEVPIDIESIFSYLLNDTNSKIKIQLSINNYDFSKYKKNIINALENEGFVKNVLVP